MLLSYYPYNFCLITANYSKGKSAHINRNDLSQHLFLKGSITHKRRSIFCANENTNTHSQALIGCQIPRMLGNLKFNKCKHSLKVLLKPIKGKMKTKIKTDYSISIPKNSQLALMIRILHQ